MAGRSNVGWFKKHFTRVLINPEIRARDGAAVSLVGCLLDTRGLDHDTRFNKIPFVNYCRVSFRLFQSPAFTPVVYFALDALVTQRWIPKLSR